MIDTSVIGGACHATHTHVEWSVRSDRNWCRCRRLITSPSVDRPDDIKLTNTQTDRQTDIQHYTVWTYRVTRSPQWARERFRISLLRFMAECRKSKLNQGSFVLLYLLVRFS